MAVWARRSPVPPRHQRRGRPRGRTAAAPPPPSTLMGRVPGPPRAPDPPSLRTTPRREGARYIVNGQKIWTSRAEHSDLILLLARTTPRDQVARKTEGLSVFLVDMRLAKGKGLSIRPIRTM